MTRNLGETRGTLPGAFLDREGRRLGTHRGIIHYTVGQRRGLRLAASEPLHVLAIDLDRNAVVVGPKSALDCGGLVTGPVNWLMPRPPESGERVEVKIRYHHRPAAARGPGSGRGPRPRRAPRHRHGLAPRPPAPRLNGRAP